MITAEKKEELLERFSAYWGKRVDAGRVSGFDRLEWTAIEIFADWLSKQKETFASTPKPQPPENVILLKGRDI